MRFSRRHGSSAANRTSVAMALLARLAISSLSRVISAVALIWLDREF
ncbi:hypothetical protein OHS33_11285 [Streptomyces sp. NBC_00536]|nr:hypothetical protein [Streptomyces sp. NBC_00536]WUC78870.1 hypothetical protein OHS33_11285 [Streptomyces sp. NBC_00536]